MNVLNNFGWDEFGSIPSLSELELDRIFYGEDKSGWCYGVASNIRSEILKRGYTDHANFIFKNSIKYIPTKPEDYRFGTKIKTAPSSMEYKFDSLNFYIASFYMDLDNLQYVYQNVTNKRTIKVISYRLEECFNYFNEKENEVVRNIHTGKFYDSYYDFLTFTRHPEHYDFGDIYHGF